MYLHTLKARQCKIIELRFVVNDSEMFLITLYCSLKCRLHDICNIGEHRVVEIYLPHVWSIKIKQHSAESIVTTFYVLACIMLYGFWLCKFRCTRLVDISSLVPLCVVQVTIITFYHNNFHHLHTHTALSPLLAGI